MNQLVHVVKEKVSTKAMATEDMPSHNVVTTAGIIGSGTILATPHPPYIHNNLL